MVKVVRISCSEDNNAWLDVSILQNALSVVLNNPYGEFIEMDYACKNKWKPIDVKDIIKKLTMKDQVVSVRNTDLEIEASVSKHLITNVITFEKKMEETADPTLLLDLFPNIAGALPAFGSGSIKCSDWIRVLYSKHQLPFSPVSFGNIGWVHQISPRDYEKHYTKSDLLNIPEALEVKENSAGHIFIKFYEHPLDYDKPENIEKIRTVTSYLDSCRIDLK